MRRLSNLLNKLNDGNDLTFRITNLSNELHGTLKKIENCTNCENEIEKYVQSEIHKSINEIENYLVELEKGEKKEQEKEDIIYKLSDELIKISIEINEHALCGACGRKHMISKLSNLLNELINRSDLTVRITNLSNELHEILKKIENCTNCEDKIGKYVWSEIHKSINEIENYLVELEKGEKKEQEKEDIIYKLSDELIKIDIKINEYALCKACEVKHLINKLTNLLNKLINRSDLTVRITNLSNELHETLKIIENCTNCEYRIWKHDWCKTYKSINEIENYLVELEKGEKKEQEKEDI